MSERQKQKGGEKAGFEEQARLAADKMVAAYAKEHVLGPSVKEAVDLAVKRIVEGPSPTMKDVREKVRNLLEKEGGSAGLDLGVPRKAEGNAVSPAVARLMELSTVEEAKVTLRTRARREEPGKAEITPEQEVRQRLDVVARGFGANSYEDLYVTQRREAKTRLQSMIESNIKATETQMVREPGNRGVLEKDIERSRKMLEELLKIRA